MDFTQEIQKIATMKSAIGGIVNNLRQGKYPHLKIESQSATDLTYLYTNSHGVRSRIFITFDNEHRQNIILLSITKSVNEFESNMLTLMLVGPFNASYREPHRERRISNRDFPIDECNKLFFEFARACKLIN